MDAEACLSDASDYERHDDEDDELRRAARAGILLLEQNQELQHENAALRTQVAALESERPTLRSELQRQENELELLREERRQSILEVHALRGELRGKSTMITDLLDREQRLRETVDEASDAKRLAEYQFARLQAEYDELALRKKASEQPQVANKEDCVVANPAATYDSNQSSVFTLADYEELVHKWQTTSAENDALQLELKSLRKDLDGMRHKTSKLVEYQQHVERLEKQTLKVQHSNDALQEELTEERALIESLRTMNATYKKIAESRPFSNECTCAMHPEVDEQELGTSMQDVLVETNRRLEVELRELRELSVRLESENEDNNTVDDSSADRSSPQRPLRAPALDKLILRRASSSSLPVTLDTPTGSDDFAASDAVYEKLITRVHDLQEKLSVAKDMIKHTKQQWQAAIASQKALEECNRTAQDEITRLTQLVDYQMSSLSGSRSASGSDAERGVDAESAQRRRRSAGDDEDDKWTEETAPYPAPPGDLNSPLIKCLLDHWTTDKSKVMHLTDWLHHAIRGTGKPTPLRLEHLTSEVAAGFTQLLVPILRERHGVSVSIYRRDSIQILTDMVLQAHHPSQTAPPPGLFASLAAKLASATSSLGAAAVGVATPPPSSVADASSSARLTRSNSGESGGSSETTGSRRRRQESPFLMSEAHFLYG